MSSALAAVRFEDGTVKWCVYSGTSDILSPRLFDSPAEAWAGYRNRSVDPSPEPIGESEPVTIYSDYGNGWSWAGAAARNVVTSPIDNYDRDVAHGGSRVDGRPDWFGDALDYFRE